MRLLLAAAALLAIFIDGSAARTDTQFYAGNNPSGVAVALAVERVSYRSGDDVRLKISVKNLESFPLELFFTGPQNDTKLTVKDQQGAVVNPSIAPEAPAVDGSITTRTLQPGETLLDTRYAAGFSSAPAMQKGDGFVSSRGWGYAFTRPGRYTIVARRILALNTFSTSSNPVVILVDP